MGYFNPYMEAVEILTESAVPNKREQLRIQAILENSKSPLTNKYVEDLYDAVLTKKHIDFGDIPNSKGVIKDYVGYTNMVQILKDVLSLAQTQKSKSVEGYVKTVQEAIDNMSMLSDLYSQGYTKKNDYVVMEYQTFVYTIVQAVSSILYEFVDYIKRPDSTTMEITIKDTKHRANLLYIEQLTKFNRVIENMEYRKFLEGMLNKGRDNFIGVETMIGVGVVTAVALSIVPITRKLVYHYFSSRAKLSDCLAQQAYFLQMNKASVESNGNFNSQKKAEILKKQENVRNLLMKISDKLRVDNVMADRTASINLSNDNRPLTIDNIRKEVSDAPLTLM